MLDGGDGLGAGGLDEAGDGAAQRLGTHGDGELVGGGAGGAGSLGGPGAGLLDGQVGLHLGLARERHDGGGGLRAELVDDGLRALDGQVTGADDGEERGLGLLGEWVGTASSPYCFTVWVGVMLTPWRVGVSGDGLGGGFGAVARCSRT